MSTATPRIETAAIPPLENGDVLTRDEFERRYDAMPELKKAELLEGEVFMGSPVSVEHGISHAYLGGWLFTYVVRTPGVNPCDNTSVRLTDVSMPQPDLFLMIKPENGGNMRRGKKKILERAPELAVEVAVSSASVDANRKRRVYERAGVLEYILWRVEDEAVDWLILRDGHYAELAATADGVLRSEVFPGLWLDRPALLGGDLPRVVEVLQVGLASPEHAAFVERLSGRK